jgi:hypothetical protein
VIAALAASGLALLALRPAGLNVAKRAC